MTTAEVRERIGLHRDEFRRMGVASLELFGSTVRDEATADSDVDILVAFDEPVGLFTLYRVQELLESILETGNVDLVVRRAVVDEMREEIHAEAVPCLEGTGSSASAT